MRGRRAGQGWAPSPELWDLARRFPRDTLPGVFRIASAAVYVSTSCRNGVICKAVELVFVYVRMVRQPYGNLLSGNKPLTCIHEVFLETVTFSYTEYVKLCLA